MYTDALSFLEDERDAFAPFEALLELSDEQLERPMAPDSAAHGWSGRELLSHLAAWQEHALEVARELAVGEESRSRAEMAARWEAAGDAVNEELLAAWRALPLAEVRRRARQIPGELRGYLTVVPEARWVKHPDNLRFFLEETIDHYADHLADLQEVLHQART